MSTPDTLYDRDGLSILFPVTDEATGGPFNLTDCSVLALAGRPGAASVAGTVSVPDPPSGEVEVVFQPSALGPALWTVQLTITPPVGVPQTVAAPAYLVQRSHPNPP